MPHHFQYMTVSAAVAEDLTRYSLVFSLENAFDSSLGTGAAANGRAAVPRGGSHCTVALTARRSPGPHGAPGSAQRRSAVAGLQPALCPALSQLGHHCSGALTGPKVLRVCLSAGSGGRRGTSHSGLHGGEGEAAAREGAPSALEDSSSSSIVREANCGAVMKHAFPPCPLPHPGPAGSVCSPSCTSLSTHGVLAPRSASS